MEHLDGKKRKGTGLPAATMIRRGCTLLALGACVPISQVQIGQISAYAYQENVWLPEEAPCKYERVLKLEVTGTAPSSLTAALRDKAIALGADAILLPDVKPLPTTYRVTTKDCDRDPNIAVCADYIAAGGKKLPVRDPDWQAWGPWQVPLWSLSTTGIRWIPEFCGDWKKSPAGVRLD